MATPPYLVEEAGELFLDVSVGSPGRKQFALSERATALLVDDLEYGNRDVVPWLTAKTLVLAGGAYLRDEKADARETAWAITGADGGREITDEELRALGEYLTSVEIDGHAVETAREHVESTRLSEVVSPDDVRGNRERTQGLRDIAKDL
ncbi:hypothetical protein [Natronomonas marina]|jgi:hypothetical protein|uniref:hypothetical protein n=1 Tax=Natronomonas marina TaxID=2961939 RepID=UPI0020C964C8|nr:hypothetical protein [Natronomonas marina]